MQLLHKGWLIAALFLASLITLTSQQVHAGPTAKPELDMARVSCEPDFAIVSSPNPPNASTELLAVSAASADDIWAVGDYRNNGQNLGIAFAEHWDGTQWSIFPVATPGPGGWGYGFYGVSALAADDVWAAGFFNDGSYVTHSLVEHWNGQDWSIVSTPNVGTQINIFFSVSARTSSDAWAVGSYSNGGSNSWLTLTEHWNGQQWQVVPSPESTRR